MDTRDRHPTGNRRRADCAGCWRRLAVFGIAVSLCCLALSSCGRDLPPMQRIALQGDRAVLSRFAGSWYAEDWTLVASVTAGRTPSLALRYPPGYRMSEARSDGDEIRFSVRWGDETADLALRLLADDVLVAVRAGEEPSWCGTCTPRYLRFDRLVRHEAEELKDRAADWLDDVLADIG